MTPNQTKIQKNKTSTQSPNAPANPAESERKSQDRAKADGSRDIGTEDGFHEIGKKQSADKDMGQGLEPIPDPIKSTAAELHKHQQETVDNTQSIDALDEIENPADTELDDADEFADEED